MCATSEQNIMNNPPGTPLQPSHPKMIEVKRERAEAKEKRIEERELVKMEAGAEIGDG